MARFTPLLEQLTGPKIPGRDYASVSPSQETLMQQSVEEARKSPEQIAMERTRNIGQSQEALVSPDILSGQDISLGGPDQEAINRAISSRASKIYASQLNRLKKQAEMNAYGDASENLGGAERQISATDAFKQGVYQRRQEYEATRRAIRQQVIGNVLGTAGTVIGGIAGGAGGAAMGSKMANPNSGQNQYPSSYGGGSISKRAPAAPEF